ncbi:17270_t:CDS:2, partial [Gigaspora margarita]
MSSSKSKETKTTLTNKQRKAIIEYKEKNPQITQADLVGWVKQKMGFDVHQSTISRLLKNKETIGENLSAKKQRTIQHPELENALIEWILQSQEKPDTTLATICLKRKRKSKERLTIALCANADGTDKLIPFVIGKSPNPRCFKSINHRHLGVTYDAIILLIDGPKCYSYGNLKLYNTTVYTLPPYTTSRIQPMDAGIIMSFKRRYRSYFIKWLLDQYESGKSDDNKMDVLTAVKFIARAWREERYVAEVLNDQEIINQVIYLEPEVAESDEEDVSMELPQVTHNEALDAICLLELYLMQQDLSDAAQTEHDSALSKLSGL